ncbi:hypothetical protein PCANB_003029 [Pneumocystis canis]|nr:hypothetical protein PCANB_003029 [Pneumocystis canis]
MTSDKEVYIIRHAQAEHNLTKNYDLKDPKLTDFGKDQARMLLLNFEQLKQVELIISSPMNRTIETVLIAFDGLLALKNTTNSNHSLIPLIILPELQETSNKNCDTCSPLKDLQKQYPFLDWSFCHEKKLLKTGFFAYEPNMIEKRAAWIRNWISCRKEKKILLVSHLNFIKYLVDQSEHWSNLEIKKYTFDTNHFFKQIIF